ncbi:MAG: hypothetical protein RIR55_132 [Bacteroidota bacterium]|jgi:hypothetical protein
MNIKQLLPVLFVFVIVNAVLLTAHSLLVDQYVKYEFVMAVNLMLLMMSLFNFNRIRKVDLKNPRAMVNSVMVGTLLKMLVFAGSALFYATQKKAPVGIPTLLASMALYLIYTWLEIKWTQTIKK